VASAIAENYELRCLLADPLAARPMFGELLGWAISGHAPVSFAADGCHR
jgi:hypothetical protein